MISYLHFALTYHRHCNVTKKRFEKNAQKEVMWINKAIYVFDRYNSKVGWWKEQEMCNYTCLWGLHDRLRGGELFGRFDGPVNTELGQADGGRLAMHQFCSSYDHCRF